MSKVSSTPWGDYTGSTHTLGLLNPRSLQDKLKKAKKLLNSRAFKKKYKVDTLAFSGYSGAMIAIPLAHETGKDLVLVRKKGVDCASSYKVEGFSDVKNYIIVDDFVSSGETKDRIREGIRNFAPEAKYLGTLEVNYLNGDSDDDLEYQDKNEED